MPKITEYTKATSFDANDVLLKDGINGTKKIEIEDFIADVSDTTSTTDGKLAKAGDIVELKSAVEDVGKASYAVAPIDFANAETKTGYIVGTGKWEKNNNALSAFVPVPNNTVRITITANSTLITRVYFLTSDNVAHQVSAPICAGTDRMDIPVSSTQEFTVPQDCAFVCFLINTANTQGYTPSSASFLGIKFIPEVDDTLTQPGEAADAKLTGDMIDDLVFCGDYNILKNLADDNFTDISKWVITVGTAVFSDNVCQFSLTNTESSTCGVQYAFGVVSGHKYYMAAEFKADHTPNTLSIGLSSANTAVTSQFTTPGVYNHISAIVTAGDSDTKYRVKIYPKSTQGFAVGDVVYIRKPMAIDLTATFGAGMEPDVDTVESALHRYFSDRSIVDVNSGNDVASTDLITKLSAPRKLTVPSYDGSGQNVHPSIVSFRSAWHGHRYWMAITPYPNTQDQYENPSILVSDDGDTWSVPSGLTNPIFPGPTTNPINGVHVHNNDPCLVYYNSKLYCYFNTWNTETGATRLYRMDSSDGVTWGNGTECTFAESGRQTEPSWTVLSPSIIKLSSGWVLLWGQYKKMYRATSSDGISWSAPEKIAFDLPDNIDMWHCSFSYEFNGYICVLSAHKDNETQNDNALYIGKSDDGLTFFFNPTPILEPFGNDYANKQIYKSCLAKIGDGYRIYFSCQNTSSQWAVGCFDIKFNNVQMTANSVTVLLANSDDAFIISPGQTKTFGILAPIGETSTLAVRTVNAANLECKVTHETVAGITASSEVVMTMSAETNKSCTFDNRSERFQILIKNTGSEDEKLHTVLVMMYA